MVRRAILHVITGLKTGGAEAMLYRLVRGLEDEWRAHVVSLTDLGSIGARLQAADVPVTCLAAKGVTSAAAMVWQLRRLIAREQPELVQGWMYHGNLAALLGVSASRVPLVWSIRAPVDRVGFERRTTSLVVRAGALLSRRVEVITYNSTVAAVEHEAIGYDARRTRVIPNGFELDLYRPDPAKRRAWRERHGIRLDTAVVGLVARFDPYKDHRNFIRAAAQVVRTHPEVRLVMAGQQIEVSNKPLMHWLKDAGLGSRALLLGQVEDVPELMTGIDILCSASLQEGFPNVVGEAMACGTPCVVTNVGDSATVVGDCGLVVPPANPDLLAQGLAALVQLGPSGRAELGDRARARIMSRFSLWESSRRFAQVYEEATARRASVSRR